MNQNGISSSQEGEIARDTGSVHVGTIPLEIASGVTLLREVGDAWITLTCPPKGKDSAGLMKRTINKISSWIKFRQYGTRGALKMPSPLTYVTTVVEQLNLILATNPDLQAKLEEFFNDPEHTEVETMQAYLDDNDLSGTFLKMAERAYSKERYAEILEIKDEFVRHTKDLIKNNLDKWLKRDPATGHFKITFEEQMDLLFKDPNGQKLDFTLDLEKFDPQTIIEVNGEKKSLTRTKDGAFRFDGESLPGKPLHWVLRQS